MNFINVRAYDNYVNANIELSLLQEQGINCHLKDENTITIDPLLSPAIGGMKLMVAEPQAARALQILEETEREWLSTVPCPACGQKDLHKEITITEFPGFWGKLKSMLANGQEREVKMVYTCPHCHTEFKELPLML
jgi:DNA-directed RNA polymerase subunit RPC12/RpoP